MLYFRYNLTASCGWGGAMLQSSLPFREAEHETGFSGRKMRPVEIVSHRVLYLAFRCMYLAIFREFAQLYTLHELHVLAHLLIILLRPLSSLQARKGLIREHVD
jgi:hypothetical protein